MKTSKNTIDDKLIKLAAENVKKHKGGPFSAIIVKNGKILSSASNNVISKNDPTAHAEIEAIRKAAKKLKNFSLSGCEIYTSCQPCPMCLSAIYWADIKKNYYYADTKTASKYGFKDGLIFKELSKPQNSRKIKQTKIKNSDSLIPFKIWKTLPNKKKY
ncbi:MAG: nucleoside deaminase [Endomicrobia bacterium]|nr:nucleoside deaminase [Endomicrobiia bacterium]MCL2507006.1 nucleoside deaminase [Endomicrobiia bacterium]